MNRVLPALVMGAAIAAGIVYIMTLLIGDNPGEPSTIGNVQMVGPVNIGDEARPVDFYPQADCNAQSKRFENLISASRACDVDSDCELAGFICPFGLVAIHVDAFPRLDREHQKLKQCQTCVYHWGNSEHEWRAVCIENQCKVIDEASDEIEELMQRTLEAIAE